MYKNNKGFTLIEMLIVLTIISVLIILIVPSLSNSSKDINQKGCEALVSVVQAQVYLYQLQEGVLPTDLAELVKHDYINSDQTSCSNNNKLLYDSVKGKVSFSKAVLSSD